MTDTLKKHRIIGIRHTLKPFKEAGLIEDDVLYPRDAVDNVQDEILSVAKRWYKIGARRGALETLEMFLNNEFTLQTDKKGETEIVAHAPSVEWERSLGITVGKDKQKLPKQQYKLTLKELEFDV